MKIWKNTGTLDAFVPELSQQFVDPADAEVAVLGSRPVDLDSMPRLRGIFKCGVGTDNVPFEECARRGIKVGLPSEGTASVIFEETASFAVSLIFRMLYSNVGDLDAWRKETRVAAQKKNVLVVGLGNIGSRVVKKLEPTVNVIGYDLAMSPLDVLEELIPKADVVTLHIPLEEGTRGFWGTKHLGLMKRGAALVNTARGPVVDEDALYEALGQHRIRAAFDVFWKEPYEGKLREMYPDPFYMTPHVASTCVDFLEGLAEDYRAFVKQF
ncbi:NAD(P)-dependent oxidoreductase [Pelagicoccus sp. SDUM812005]|uniref:NAD(P)-dependent oxidoreductase n=1 Tax=Pelagicoccus sp. SDUM812005 TaxID=3041257 RepID=UPI00280D73B4|nr:NAD(P)-dependent oxidoreductase [Pelagicoccus sp. SDUM812005]MDQ8180923.1 NAD(P)-dependent oxidoreductase [Pelagicoccus sp. SDUM812005]